MAAPATGCGSKRGPAASSKEDRGTYNDMRGAQRFSKGRGERLGFRGFSVKPTTKLTFLSDELPRKTRQFRTVKFQRDLTGNRGYLGFVRIDDEKTDFDGQAQGQAG